MRPLAALLILALTATGAEKATKHREATEAFLAGPIPELELEIAKEDYRALKEEPKRYVEATLREGDKVHKGVAVKLKGNDGSFRPIDDKPGFTLNFSKFKGAERFHGLKRMHLNNGREDPTFLRQILCGEMARAAGVPAVRGTHALVKLNGRNLGLYVLTESYTPDFLAQFFDQTEGDLYEGGFCSDIDDKLEKDEGDPKDFRIIQQLLAAARENDAAVRWEKLSTALDTDRFASFLAMESLMGVGDGYNFFRNNYRIYHDPATQRLAFVLHGMDQPLGDVGFDIQRRPESIVGRAFYESGAGRRLYRERVVQFAEKVFASRDWPGRVDEVAKKMCAAVAKHNARLAKELEGRAREFRGLVAERQKNIGEQVAELGTPFEFDAKGVALLPAGWRFDGDGAEHSEQKFDGSACLHLRATGDTTASWRRSVDLDAGKYRFEARIRTQGVKPGDDESGVAAGLRISGSKRHEQNSSRGDTPWQTVAFDFETDGGGVVLVAELRASSGEVWFDKTSMRLLRR
jgi:spore coat protein H